jgi:hypothetical protein
MRGNDHLHNVVAHFHKYRHFRERTFLVGQESIIQTPSATTSTWFRGSISGELSFSSCGVAEEEAPTSGWQEFPLSSKL